MSITRSITRALTQPLTRPLTAPGIGGGGDPILDAALALSPVFLYDHKDITSFFSDAAMTTQAVVNGPVGAVRDSSGNGWHRKQTDNAKRPTLRQSGDLYYIEYNGTSHFLVTAAIDLTATDAVTICLGVHKRSDATTAVVAEFSALFSSNAGSMALFAPPAAASTNATFYSRGTANAASNKTIGAAPVTAVLRGSADISADSVVCAANGVEGAASASDQGTGNYGNYPFYFGARGGTGLFFYGYEYGGALYAIKATGADLTAIEAFVADRTGVTL